MQQQVSGSDEIAIEVQRPLQKIDPDVVKTLAAYPFKVLRVFIPAHQNSGLIRKQITMGTLSELMKHRVQASD